jgi:pimeloyl-ACP methyl ester carboxylesterase
VGELDPVTPVAAAREIYDPLPAGIARLEVIDGAGHFPMEGCTRPILAAARRIREKGDVMMQPDTSGVARVNGIELAYRVVGEGEPLILFHGGFGSVEMFGPNVELLAARRQVIGVDLQSHGRSPAADRPIRFETMADDIAALIQSCGFERAAIMGFSLGGGVGLRTAIQHPGLVERLVLVSTVFKRQG